MCWSLLLATPAAPGFIASTSDSLGFCSGGEPNNQCFNYLLFVMAFLSRVLLFLIPTIVAASVLYDHAAYLPDGRFQPSDRSRW